MPQPFGAPRNILFTRDEIAQRHAENPDRCQYYNENDLGVATNYGYCMDPRDRREDSANCWYHSPIPPHQIESGLVTKGAAQPQTVYMHWNVQGEPLYVGITHRQQQRQCEHTCTDWWPEIARTTYEHVLHRKAARFRESILINTLAPLYNIRGYL
jgi:hypothetical protein